MVGSVSQSPFYYNDMLTGDIEFSDNNLEINDFVTFSVKNLKSRSEELLGAAKILAYNWDINCNMGYNGITTKPFFEYKFQKEGTYTLCVKIDYYYGENNKKKFQTILSNEQLSIKVFKKPPIPSNLVLNPYSSYNFTKTDKNYSSAPLLLEIKNTGELKANITDSGLKDSNSFFLYTGLGYPGKKGTCTNTIEPKSTCFVELVFQPRELGFFTEILEINYSDTIEYNKSVSILLEGEAVEEASYLVAGFFNSFDNESTRISFIDPNGVHSVFNDAGLNSFHHILSMAWHSDGKLVVGGGNLKESGLGAGYSFFIARFNSDGSRDQTWRDTPQPGSTLRQVIVDSNDKIIILGPFTSIGWNFNKNHIARINYDGTVDNTFDVGAGTPINNISSIDLTDENKLIVAGDFNYFNGVEKNKILRLNEDGSIDDTFDVGIGPNDRIVNFKIQNDGKIIIIGNFTSFNGISISKIARINEDGSLDSTFYPSDINFKISQLAINQEGRIIISGSLLNTITGVYNYYVSRLNQDGSTDASFNTAYSNNFINTLIAHNDKIIAAGNFTTFNSVPINRIVRLHSDGSIDNGFINFPNGFNDTIRTIIKY